MAAMDSIDTRLEAIERRLDAIEQADPSAKQELGISESDIKAAYRIFLGREADSGGLAHYLARAQNPEFRYEHFVVAMTDCEEYRAKHQREIKTVEVGGTLVAVDPDEPEFGRVIASHGAWEPHIMAAIAANLSQGDVFVDVGANVGVMSFQAARAIGSTGRVIAFEPNPENVQRFLQGMVLNGFENVLLYPFAASRERATFSMQGYSNTHLVPVCAGGRLVQSLPLDILLAGEQRVDLIKIDIEGHELHAIAGMRATLHRHKPLVLCEFNPRCLRDNGHVTPEALAETIFELTDSVALIESDGSRPICTRATDLLERWHRRDAALTATGKLAPGLLHFDLLFRVER